MRLFAPAAQQNARHTEQKGAPAVLAGATPEKITAALEQNAPASELKSAHAVSGAPKAEQIGATSEQITATAVLGGAVGEQRRALAK